MSQAGIVLEILTLFEESDPGEQRTEQLKRILDKLTTALEKQWHDEDDDHEYFVNGVSILRVTYDDHGSAGMRAANLMFKKLSEQLGVQITYREGAAWRGARK